MRGFITRTIRLRPHFLSPVINFSPESTSFPGTRPSVFCFFFNILFGFHFSSELMIHSCKHWLRGWNGPNPGSQQMDSGFTRTHTHTHTRTHSKKLFLIITANHKHRCTLSSLLPCPLLFSSKGKCHCTKLLCKAHFFVFL